MSELGEERRAVRRGAALMATGTLTSRVLGLLRGMVLVAAVGATGQGADAFSVANKLPNVLFTLLAGGVLNAVLVPQLVRAYRQRIGQEYVDRLLTVGFAVLGVLTVVLTMAAPLLVKIYSGGGHATTVAEQHALAAQQSLATSFAFWCVPQLFFYGAYALLGQVLNARGSFGPYMWAPVLNNIVSIAGFGVFILLFGGVKTSRVFDATNWSGGQVALFAGSATLAVACQALVLFPAMRAAGVYYRPRWGLKDSGLGHAGRIAGWALAGLGVGQIGYVIVSRTAWAAPAAAGGSSVGVGAVAGNAAYDAAFLVFILPHSLVTVSLATALFTRLSAQAHDGDADAARTTMSYGMRVVGLFTVLATAVIVVLAVPVTHLILWTATQPAVHAVAGVVIAMILGITPYGAWSMYQRVYYAYEDARGMFPVQVAMAVVVIVGAVGSRYVLSPRLWVAGAGLAMSVSYLVGALWSAWHLRRWIGHVDGPRVVRLHVRAAVAALFASVVGVGVHLVLDRAMPWGHLRALLECAVVGTLMTAIYIGALRAMHVRELESLLGPVLNRLPTGSRRGRPSSMSRTSAQVGEVAVTDVVRGTLVAGRYRVVSPLPSDLPSSTSWSGADQILDRRVRVRILPASSAVALDAARRAALVSDPRLVRVLDVGSEEGHGYVVGEHVAGTSLEELLADGPLTPDQARAVVGEAAAALEVARRRGVHHLSLRPSVVHLSDDGRVVVSGLALDAALLGAPAGDARVTSRADAVGLVRLLYAALTGYWPSDARSPAPSGLPAAPLMDGAPIAPADLVGGVPNDLDTLCVVTLGPHEDGPHTPGELVRELEPWGEIRREDAAGPAERASEFDAVAFGAGAAPAAASAAAPTAAAARAGAPAQRDVADATAANAPIWPAGLGAAADPGETGTISTTAIWLAGLDADRDSTSRGAHAPGPRAGDGTSDGPAAAAVAGAGAGAVASAGAGSGAGAVAGAAAGFGAGSGADAGTRAGAVADAAAAVAGASAVGAAQGPTGPRSEATVDDDLSDTLPVRVHRQSVRSAFEAPGTGTNRPGTPPPAAPVRTSAFGGPPLPSFPPRDAPEQPLPPADSPFVFEEIRQSERRRFNPTGLVLAVVVLAVIVGVVLAAKALFSSIEHHSSTPPHSTSSAAAQSPTTSETPKPTSAAPVIASASTYDPSAPDAGEHPELAAAAIDGNPATAWYTRTYKNPQFSGLKKGVALIIQLKEPAVVSQVTLTSASQGGAVEIRPGDPTNPSGGQALASGPMTGTTTFKLSQPTSMSSVVIWVSQLPDSAGKIRLEVNEVAIS